MDVLRDGLDAQAEEDAFSAAFDVLDAPDIGKALHQGEATAVFVVVFRVQGAGHAVTEIGHAHGQESIAGSDLDDVFLVLFPAVLGVHHRIRCEFGCEEFRDIGDVLAALPRKNHVTDGLSRPSR